jgi:hypothetical protein
MFKTSKDDIPKNYVLPMNIIEVTNDPHKV